MLEKCKFCGADLEKTNIECPVCHINLEEFKAGIISVLDNLKPLSKEDFISVEAYGGGRSESKLKGTRNALAHFGLNVLQTIIEEKENWIDVVTHPNSSVGIDYIELIKGEPPVQNFKKTVTDRVILFIVTLLFGVFLASAFYGFVNLIQKLKSLF